MKIFPIPIFSDNYVWTLVDGTDAVVVDPGDAAPVQAELRAHGLRLRAILITHWHPDHIGGLPQLLEGNPVPVYGPDAERSRIAALTEPVAEGKCVEVPGGRFSVLHVPGHTLGHIAYHDAANGTLLCGDTLFSGGCGRLFEGTPAQMYASLRRLAGLPADTQVYCTHEYTAANLAFAAAADPDNRELLAYARQVRTLRAQDQPTLPTRIGLEQRINPFLRCDEPALRRSAERQAGKPLPEAVEVFTALRRWKDHFKAPA